MFDGYGENLNDDEVMERPAADEDIKRLIEGLEKLAKRDSIRARKRGKKLRKIKKKIRKIQKVIKTETRDEKEALRKPDSSQNNEKEAPKNVALNQEGKKETGKEVKSFFNRLGDVFLKALPGLLTTVVSVAVKMVFDLGFGKGQKWRKAVI